MCMYINICLVHNIMIESVMYMYSCPLLFFELFLSLLSPLSLPLFLQLPIGRQSIEHYRSLSRTPVFSHDELLCKMVAQPEKLELCLLPTSSEDMSKMTALEEKLRLELKQSVRYIYTILHVLYFTITYKI